MDFLLDKDRAGAVFELLFAFSIDDACQQEEFHSFSESVSEVLGGARVSVEVLTRLRPIFERICKEPKPLQTLLQRVYEDFEDDREALVSLFSILLRLSSSEGMLSKRDLDRIKLSLEIFDFCGSELECLTDTEKAMIEFCFESGVSGAKPDLASKQTLEYYRILKCTPESPDEEVRRQYRELAKRYHPDTQKVNGSQRSLQKSRLRFEQVQFAYEQIRSLRNI